MVLDGDPLDPPPMGCSGGSYDLKFGALAIELQIIHDCKPLLVHDPAERYLRDRQPLPPAWPVCEHAGHNRRANMDSVRQRLDAQISHHVDVAAVATDRRAQGGNVGEAIFLDI